jgi:hypothetical protein
MMTKRKRNIKNIFIMLQMGTNIMSNQVIVGITESLTFSQDKIHYYNQEHSSSHRTRSQGLVTIFFIPRLL